METLTDAPSTAPWTSSPSRKRRKRTRSLSRFHSFEFRNVIFRGPSNCRISWSDADKIGSTAGGGGGGAGAGSGMRKKWWGRGGRRLSQTCCYGDLLLQTLREMKVSKWSKEHVCGTLKLWLKSFWDDHLFSLRGRDEARLSGVSRLPWLLKLCGLCGCEIFSDISGGWKSSTKIPMAII